MGSADDDPDANDDEKPSHTVYLDAFWIDQTEVTNAMYAPCVADGRCEAPNHNGSRRDTMLRACKALIWRWIIVVELSG